MGDDEQTVTMTVNGDSSDPLPLKRGIDTVEPDSYSAKNQARESESLQMSSSQDAACGDAGASTADPSASNSASVYDGACSNVAAGSPSQVFEISVTFKKDKYNLQVTDMELIKDIKTRLEPLCGVPSENQKLMYKSMLADASTVAAAGLKAGTKVMLIGTSKQEIQKEQLNKIVAAVQPLAAAAVMQPTKLSDATEHKKIIEKGVPEGASPGIVGRKAPLIELNNVIRNVYDKRGELVRLTFKLEDNQLWIGAKARTDKLNLDQIRGVTWEPITGHAGYNILILQAGSTDKSNLYFYFVPAQYCDDVRRIVLS